MLKGREKKAIRVIGQAGEEVKAGKEITTTIALDSLTFEVKTVVKEGVNYRCPCGCDRSEKMAGEIRKLEASAALDAIDKALASIAGRENLGYVSEQRLFIRIHDKSVVAPHSGSLAFRSD